MASMAGAGWMQGASALLQAWGSMEQGRMQRVAGERARVAAEFAAWQAEEQAGLAIAVSQRTAAEQRRQGELLASRALAVAASSGGGASDPTIVRILSNAKGEAAYRANVALYEGESRARQLRMDAAAGRMGGWQSQAAGAGAEQSAALAAGGKLAGTGASLYAKYGGSGPGLPPAGSGDYKLIDQADYGGSV